jgi:hypothetical protein
MEQVRLSEQKKYDKIFLQNSTQFVHFVPSNNEMNKCSLLLVKGLLQCNKLNPKSRGRAEFVKILFCSFLGFRASSFH